MRLPDGGGLVVALKTFGGIPLEYRGIETVRIQAEDVDEIFPGPVDGLLLEIVAEAPVPEHLEHSMVIGVVTHLFKIVVLSRHAQTLLAVGHAAVGGRMVSKDYILELVHSGVGKHQCRVILDDHRCGGHDRVSLFAEESLERLSDFF